MKAALEYIILTPSHAGADCPYSQCVKAYGQMADVILFGAKREGKMYSSKGVLIRDAQRVWLVTSVRHKQPVQLHRLRGEIGGPASWSPMKHISRACLRTSR